MSSIVMLSAEQNLPNTPGTEVLAEYPSGERLIRTDAPQVESHLHTSTHGLSIEGVTHEMMVEAESLPMAEAAREGELLSFIEFAGPIHADWLDKVKELGIQVIRFQPRSAYLCRGAPEAFDQAKDLPFVISVVPLVPEIKPSIVVSESGTEAVWVIVEGSADTDAIVDQIKQIEGLVLEGVPDKGKTQCRVPARIDGEAIEAVLQNPMVLSIEQRVAVSPEDEVADLILCGSYNHQGEPVGSYLRWLEDHGINGRNVTIGIVDDGVDETHDAYSDRIVSKDNGRRWHGTFVAGHAAGNYLSERDSDNFIYGLGMAPASGLISQDNQSPSADLCDETVSTRAPNGVNGSVQNNSWGTGSSDPMDYRSQEAAYDEYVRDASRSTSSSAPLTICFSAGNRGEGGLTRPKAAKNVLVTGNSENLRDVGGSDSDNINEVYHGAHASSRGNCADGRIRPHVVAPGEWTASANFDSNPGDAEFISTKLTWGGGTSGASPKTAGACALLTQWWKDRNAGDMPSPALLRAMIVNGAEDMNYRGPIPNPYQGWGRLNLDNVLSNHVHHLYVDQSTLLRHRGEERFWRIKVSDPGMPLRITLAWTDPPGGINTGTHDIPAVVNFLGLRVDVDGQTYYGNNFAQGWSRSGELPDPDREGWDNLQNVYLRAGSDADEITVRVRALNITTNCLDGSMDRPQQDFALVITNGFLDSGSSPTDVFLVIDDTSPGSGSGFDDEEHWEPGSGDDDEDDTQWWTDVDAQDRPTLRRGSDGHHVEILQRLLDQLGFLDGAVDGDFGSGTRAAVKDFQRANGLSADGVVGSGTWTALYAAADNHSGDPQDSGGDNGAQNEPVDSGDTLPHPPAGGSTVNLPTLRRGDRGEHVITLQGLLFVAGYLSSSRPDGIFGRGTQSAVREFQRDNGLLADGICGSATWAALHNVIGETSQLDATQTFGQEQPCDDPWWGDDWRDDWTYTPGSTMAETVQGADHCAVTMAAYEGMMIAAHGESSAKMVLPVPVSSNEESSADGNPGNECASFSAENHRSLVKFTETLSEGAMPGLEEALQRLMASWQDWGDKLATGQARYAAGVIVVGAHTTISNWALSAMRRIALHGHLTIISTDESKLQFLLQRLHMHQGVSFRRATVDNVDEYVRNAVTSNSGAHGVILREERFTDRGGNEATRIGLRINEHDRRVVLEIRSDDELQITVKPPVHEAIKLSTRSRRDWIRLSRIDGVQRIEMMRTKDHDWEGPWNVRIQSPNPLSVNAWAWSSMSFSVAHILNSNSTESSEHNSDFSRLSVKAGSGCALQQVSAKVRETAGLTTEQTRTIRAAVKPCRLDVQGQNTEFGGSDPDEMPMSNTVDVQLPKSASGMFKRPQLIDAELELRGETTSGQRFERRIHSCSAHLVPRSEWRRLCAENKHRQTHHFIEGELKEVHETPDGQIQRVRIMLNEQDTRLLLVQNQKIREQLTELRANKAKLQFKLSGNQVISVRTALAQHGDN